MFDCYFARVACRRALDLEVVGLGLPPPRPVCSLESSFEASPTDFSLTGLLFFGLALGEPEAFYFFD